MGGVSSTAKTTDDDVVDDAWAERAWVDGVPFTLLHDEAFVTEKYQELKRTPKAIQDIPDGALEMTGTDELPMDELERMADAARIKLYTNKREKRGDDERPRKMLSVLEVMKGTPLERPSQVWVTFEQRRAKQCEIVRDYYAQLANHLKKRVQAEKERIRHDQQKQSESTTVGDKKTTAMVSRDGVSCAALPDSSLFQVASFRMQLELLKAFRITNDHLFENGLLSLVNTIQEFPPFVLHSTVSDENETTDAVLAQDVYRFCTDMLQVRDLSSLHRDILVIVLLALGICSGRSTYLIEFVAVFARRVVSAEDNSLLRMVGGRSLGDWIDESLTRLEAYRVHYELGDLKENNLLKLVSINTIKDDVTPEKEVTEFQQPASIATDGSYVYTWSLRDGLSKIGTGLNFTVAGRVYARASARQYLQDLRRARTFHCGFYGSGLDATRLLQQFAAIPTRAHFEETILSALSSEDERCIGSAPYRLFLQLERHGERISRVFDHLEDLCSMFTETSYLEGTDILFAFYGDFVVLQNDAMRRLEEAAAREEAKDGSSGVLLDSALMEEVLANSGASSVDVSSEKELVLLYSISSTPSKLFLEKYAIGDSVSNFDRPGDKIYFSSMICCGGQIYLSLLYPLSSGKSQSQDDVRHEPRSLFQISPTDLSCKGIVSVSAGDADIVSGQSNESRVSQPLFVYLTEGRRVYEVEMSAERFHIRIFGFSGSTTEKTPVFVRCFEVEVKEIQCATFVDCFLKILKREIRVGDLDFTLPTLFTNGLYMWMLLPTVSASQTSRTSDPMSRFDCFIFDCDHGQFVLEGSQDPPPVDDKRILKSFERTLPSSSCCFDALNNTIWIANMAHGTLSVFKNSGRRLPNPDDDLATCAPHEDVAANAVGDSVLLRVLSFLAKHSADGTQGVKLTSCPYSIDKDASNLVHLLDISECFLRNITSGAMAPAREECLRCCLSIMRRSLSTAGILLMSPAGLRFQERLPKFLSAIIQGDQPHGTSTSSSDMSLEDPGRHHHDVRVVASALALSAQTTCLVDNDLTSQMDRVVSLIRKWQKESLSPSDYVVVTSLLRQSRNIISDAPAAEIFEKFKHLWSELVEAQENVICDDQFDDDDTRRVVHQELLALVSFFIQHTFNEAFRSVDAFQFALRVFDLVCQGTFTASRKIANRISEAKNDITTIEMKMQVGLVRQIAPMCLLSATMILRNWSDVVEAVSSTMSERSVQHNSEQESTHDNVDIKAYQESLRKWLKSEATVLQELYQSLALLADALNAGGQVKTVSTVSRTTRTEVMESSHEYENNLDVTQELRIHGATQITITFDSRTRTENGYDYVTFYKDKAQTSFYGEQYYTGRDGDINWPGVSGIPPLIIEGDHCYVHFHTDGTNTDWGYKFTAVGELFEKTSVLQPHWLTSLTEMAAGMIDETARLLIQCTHLVPITEAEARNDKLLRSELIRQGATTEREQDAGVARLLRDFVLAPEGSDAARVLNALEQASRDPRLRSLSKTVFGASVGVTSTNPVNTAIRAAVAAILHHNMWGMDAYALAQNLRSDVSEQLQRTWKNAQKMRDWFHLGDAADASRSELESPSSRSSRNLLRRQPSAYRGMSDDALEILSKNVVERASFLLEMIPMSFSYVSGAKRRWGFIAKYGSALRLGMNSLSRPSSNSTLGKWYSLLDELQEATELRSLLHYRRSSSERRKSQRMKSVTEQVLEFIQSDIDIGELRELIRIRNSRAEYRGCGLSLYRSVSTTAQSMQVKMVLAESCSNSLRKIALEAATALDSLATSTIVSDSLSSGRLHFGTFLSACDGVLRKDVNNAFEACLSHYVQEIAFQDVFDTEYVVALMKVMCIDYDVDDSYLLQESNMLPQLLRLLASKASRVQRCAQVLLDVLLSRLADGGDTSDDPDSDSANHFQTQLFATVGLQLEGVSSQFRNSTANTGSSARTLRDREHNLGDPLSALTVPVSSDCDVRWNHSIMLWIYVSSALSSYSLKIGDEVRRGPSRTKDNKQDGDEDGSLTGIVTSITSPTSVRVKWSGKTEEAEYEFDPRNGKYEVVLVDDGIGGVVFCKGTTNLVKNSVEAAPWSHFGLFLNDQRQLSYRISSGPEKECVYDTNYELDCNEWAHVAIIQNEEVLKFYINGLMVAQHILDPLLVIRSDFASPQSRMIESTHPMTGQLDQYWPIHIPGASKIRVIFDPLSEIDQLSGFVRFYKNARCREVWGEDKYTGRYHDPERNFPGALSNRHRSRRSLTAVTSQGALEIPSDRFLVYFHHNSNDSNDQKNWGFRILATPLFSSAQARGIKQPSLNTHPLFIGEPPSRIVDMQAARCWLYQPQIMNTPLKEEEIVENMQALCPTSAPSGFPLQRALHVVGLLHTCIETPRGRELIATPENVGDLISLAFEEVAPVEVRYASAIVLKELCASLSAQFISDQFERVKPVAAESQDFVSFVFRSLSNSVGVWSRCCNSTPSNDLDTFEKVGSLPSSPVDLQTSSIERKSLVTAYTSLFRHLAQNSDWLPKVCDCIESAVSRWNTLQLIDSQWTDAAAEITAALVVLGGAYNGVGVGGRVKCCATIDSKETIENGYLLRFQQKSGARTARILFDCEPTNPINVPTTDVAYLDDKDQEELAAFVKIVAPLLLTGMIQPIYRDMLTRLDANLPFEHTSFKPRISRKENVEVLESEHPYASGEDITYPLIVHGVQEIVIYFDEQSCTVGPNDYVSFLKRTDDNRSESHVEAKNEKPYWGEERYFGEKFPGVRGTPPLCIPASSVDVYFHTESSSMGLGVPSSEWGFKLTAHGYEEMITYAPEVPPSFRVNAINDIQARVLKSLHSWLRLLKSTSLYDSVFSAMRPLVPCVAKLANTSDDGRPIRRPSRSQTFESKHPYNNSVRECMSVTFSGASQLIIAFDAQSKTEHEKDYVSFFKDPSLSGQWGAEKYSGCDDLANWPGVGNRRPLIIPSDSFTLLWETDASNVEWGWRFTVTVEYPVITPMSLGLDQLDKQAEDMWEIFYEGIGPQRQPFLEEYEGYEKYPTVEEWHQTKLENDPSRLLLLSALLNDTVSVKQQEYCKYRVVDTDGAEILRAPDSSLILGKLNAGDELHVIEESKEWLKTTSIPDGIDDKVGWVKRRTGDKAHVVSVAKLLQNEDVLVIGVDDSQANLLKPDNSLHLDDNSEHGMLSTFVSQFSIEALKTQSTRYQSLAYDVHRALSIKYAREALHLFISSPKGGPAYNLPICDFGSPSEFLLLLSHIVDDQGQALDNVALENGLRRLLLTHDGESNACILIDRCLEVLTEGVHMLPPGRGTMRVLESRHPYPDDAELYWQISVPGAKRILVYFDPQSKTEENCDWVCLYKNGTDRSEFYGESLYHGRNGTENWPGCGGRPPLVIDADNFEVYFHSDATQNDWGFKLFAIGVFDEDDRNNADTPRLDEAKNQSLVNLMRLSLWLLGVAVRACLTSPEGLRSKLASSVFSPRVVEMISRSIQDHPRQIRPLALELLLQLVQNIGFVHSLPSSMIEDLYYLLTSKIRAQILREEHSDTKSEYFQSLVECALFMDFAADSGGYVHHDLLRNTPTTPLTLLSRSVEGYSEVFEWSTAPVSGNVGCIHLRFLLENVSGPIKFRLVCDITSPELDEAAENKILLEWESNGALSSSPSCGLCDDAASFVPVQSGDAVTIFVDLEHNVLVLRKNNLCVFSSFRFDPSRYLQDRNGTLRVVVISSNKDDSIDMENVSSSPLASLCMALPPNWYYGLRDSVSLLFDFEEQRISSVVECESEHPLTDCGQMDSPEQICISGAEALEIRFDRRTVMDDRHCIRFFTSQRAKAFETEVVGVRGTDCDEKYPALFLNDSIKRTGVLTPGDCVVRSSDWCYADEDGGPGCIGVVEEIVAWGGRNGCGVRVRWTGSRQAEDDKEAFVGVYRYGYEGFFDVQMWRKPKDWDTPLIIPGDTVEYIFDFINDENADEGSLQVDDGAMFQGSLRIDTSTVLNLDVRKTKLMLGVECTIEFWIILEEQLFTSPPPGTVFSLIDITTLDPMQGLCVGATMNGQICVLARTEEGNLTIQSAEHESTGNIITENQWTHIAIVFSSSKAYVYANGQRAVEKSLDQKVIGRNLYLSALQFGGQKGPSETSSPQATINPPNCHVCDVRIWDTALRSEQVHGHARGIDSLSRQDSIDWQSPGSPPAPRNQADLHFNQLLPPPSPPRSPRSLSRALGVPLHQRKWITTNRTGKELVTLRADCPIPVNSETNEGPIMIYYEAHILSSGKVCIGYVDLIAKPSSRHSLLGEYEHAVGFELPRKRVHFGGNGPLELEEADAAFGELRSPRRRSSSSGGVYFGDVFAREGDVVGCAFVPSTKTFMFYLNGELLIQVQQDSEPSPDRDHEIQSPRRVQRQFDQLVDEMLSMGFSRPASEAALEATSGTDNNAVPRAIEWLLEEGTAVSSPRRLSNSSPFASPRRRLSSGGSSFRQVVSAPCTTDGGQIVPAVTLASQGAQGVAWNLGQHAFKYTPEFDGVVLAALTASGRECHHDDVTVCFDIFDHNDEKWERVAHRHRVQEMVSTLLGRWMLNEGTGTKVYDSSGRGQEGTIQIVQSSLNASTNPSSPRPRKHTSCWDLNCVPPVSLPTSSDTPAFVPFPTTDAPSLARGTRAAVWGYRFYVIPHFSTSSIGRRRFQTQAHKFIMNGPAVEPRHDHQLTKYVNKVAATKQLSLSQVLREPWSELAPSDDELVKWPVLVEVATGVVPSMTDNDGSATSRTLAAAKAKTLDRLGKRFKLLQELNSAVSRLLPFVAFSETPTDRDGDRLDKLVCNQRYRIFHVVKRGLWDEALKRTTEEDERCELIVNRPMAMRHRISGKVDTEGRMALFSQAFRQLRALGNPQFRQTNAIYKVKFLGENAEDAGGPYRETFAQYADELHSSQLPLLIASSNAQHNVGGAREKWVLNPSATSATQLEMLEFLGKLMGAAIRSKGYLSLRLASLIWKKLVGERVTTDDLALVDSMIVSSMDKIRTIDQLGVTADMFEDIVMETFTTLSTDNRLVPLKPHGASIAVTFDSRVEFANLVESYRLHEFDLQISALLRGLAKVVPPRLLSLFTGAELEQLVCGSPEVDVDLLQRCTEYSKCNPDDTHIVWFWQVLHDFSHEERSAFLRFVWGRSRLPPSEKDFSQWFKIQSFSKATTGANVDGYLPISHTCFFSIELPQYSSIDVVREKLTYAMYNCQEIDGDGDSVAANQLGWEE